MIICLFRYRYGHKVPMFIGYLLYIASPIGKTISLQDSYIISMSPPFDHTISNLDIKHDMREIFPISTSIHKCSLYTTETSPKCNNCKDSLFINESGVISFTDPLPPRHKWAPPENNGPNPLTLGTTLLSANLTFIFSAHMLLHLLPSSLIKKFSVKL